MADAAMTNASDVAASLLLRGETAERAGDLAQAQSAYRAALDQLPGHVATRRRLAEIERQLGNADEAALLGRQADDHEIRERLDVARALIGTPLQQKSSALAARLAADFPAHAAAQYGYAEFLRREGQIAQAIAVLQRGLAAQPAHGPSLALLDTLQQRTRIASGLRPVPFRLMTNFLDAEKHARLLAHAIEHEELMTPSAVESARPKPDWRRSRIVYGGGEIAEWFAPLVMQRAQAIVADFGYADFPVGSVGLDWVASNDGDFYKDHVDTGPGRYALRAISFVYYFNRQPKGFSGGELALYDTDLDSGEFNAAHRTVLEPLDNRLVLFPSAARHEILPVRCPGRQFADSRFTLNGWIRRAADPDTA
jgi:tetratricopeptide (TPR) repeat protein